MHRRSKKNRFTFLRRIKRILIRHSILLYTIHNLYICARKRFSSSLSSRFLPVALGLDHRRFPYSMPDIDMLMLMHFNTLQPYRWNPSHNRDWKHFCLQLSSSFSICMGVCVCARVRLCDLRCDEAKNSAVLRTLGMHIKTWWRRKNMKKLANKKGEIYRRVQYFE